jgi:dipeptidyl aminopeptidase/acylaminoacyl peptidase
VAFSPNGQGILTGGDDQTAKVWEATIGRELLTFKGHTGNIRSAGFSSDGQRVVTGSEDNSARVWDATTSRLLFTLPGHQGWVRSVAFSADDRWIATGSGDRTAILWDAATGKERHTLVGHHGPIFSVAFSPDGRWLLTGSGDRTAKLWEVTTGQELRTLEGHFGWILSVAFSPDGQRIVTGSENGTAEVWEASTGTRMLTLKWHNGAIFSATFSPDGRRIVTGSEDGTAKVLDAASGKELLTLKGHTAPVVSATFSRDGRRIVTGSLDNTAKVWASASPSQVAGWQEQESSAEKRLNALRDQRAKEEERQRATRAGDEGALKQWLVLAPVPLTEGETGAQGLDRQQLPDEARLRPRADQKTLIDGKSFGWDEVHLPDFLIDFNQLLGERTEHSVAYAVCYIVADAAKTGLVMKMGCDEEAKVYLNSQQVLQRRYITSFIADDFEARAIRLNQGLNVLVFKVVNEQWNWQGSVRLADKDGNPVKGIKVTLEPEAKDVR